MAENWSMPRRGEGCAACGAMFDIGQAFQAFLYEGTAGYERRDYCLRCSPPAAPAPVGSWRTRRPEPADPRRRTFDLDAIYRFFERLDGATEPHQVQFRFVLALMLWRKKALVLDRTDSDGGSEVWHFHTPKSDLVHQVTRPELDEDQLDRLSAQVEALLTGEGPVEAMVPADSAGDP